jgi:LmbE family N-acetylglucosaminyl deacetylase
MLARSLLALIAFGACHIAAAQPMAAPLVNPVTVADDQRVENWKDKTILVFTPHPDDETFSSGGTLARLTANGNKVIVVIYTNDNKGSKDLDMTRERLAQIRRAEEEKACEILGIRKENIHWLGYEDGDLEYADPRVLRGEACRLIKTFRPDAVFSPDPGTTWVQWHKTDHRMAANITQDAFIAAEWHLYYPQHLLDEGLKPYSVPVAYYYYSQQPNYEVDITAQFDAKIQASAAHVSQFEPSTTKYTPDMPAATMQLIKAGFSGYNKQGDRFVERFRRVNAP